MTFSALFGSSAGYALWARSATGAVPARSLRMKLPRTMPVIGLPFSVAIGISIRIVPGRSGTSHCHPIQSSVKPWRISAPSPNSASVVGSGEPAAFWKVDSIALPPRLPTS